MNEKFVVGLWVLFTVFIFFAMDLKSQQPPKTFVVKGRINDLPNDVNITLITENELRAVDTVQMAISKDEKFNFEITNPIFGKMYFVVIDTSVVKLTPQKKNWIRFVLDTSLIEISGTLNDWPVVDIGNTRATLLYEDYHKVARMYNQDLFTLIMKGSKNSKSYKEVEQNYMEFSIDYFERNRNSVVTPLLILKSQSLDPTQKKKAYEKLSKESKNSYYGRKLNSDIPILMAKDEVEIGRKIPDFWMENERGEIVAIRELIKKNKLTLLDFWAHWCVPCKEDIPSLKRTYEAFKNRGFNVISISIDPKKEPWKKALSELKTDWFNLIDSNDVSRKLFSINGIPAYILLNDMGNIIATDIPARGYSKSDKFAESQTGKLRGDELYKKIGSLLSIY